MTASNAERCIANTLVYEGGFTANRKDPGNWTGGNVGVGQLKGTNFGIAANSYPDLDIRSLTKAEAIAIYKRDFWPKVAGDAMPTGVDQLAYDAGVNSGPSRGVRWIAEAVDVPPGSKASAVAAAANAVMDKAALIKRASARRMAFLHGLGSFASFGAGWTRRVAAIEAIGVKMAMEVSGETRVSTKLDAEAKSAKADSNKAITKSATAGGGDVVVHQAVDTSNMEWLGTGLLWLGIAAALVVVCFYAWHAFMHRQRAQAYADAAQGKIGG